MSYSHVVFCGDSYMRCYIDSNGHLELCKQLGAEPVMLYRSGSAHEYVINHIYNKIAKLPKCLIIWGLSFPSRLDVPYSDPITRKSMWATLNYDHIVGDDDKHNFNKSQKNAEDDRLLNLFKDYLYNTLNHSALFIEKSLQQIAMTAGWLKNNGHDYLIWNQAAGDFSHFKEHNFPVMADIASDSGFYRLFDFYMNQHTHDCGVPIRDIDYYNGKWHLAAHPLECEQLSNVINTFILDNLKGRNLI